MLFITNRFPTQSIRTRKGRRFTFDLDNNAPSNSVFYCEKSEDEHHTEITSKELLRRVRDNNCRQILLYLHGFNNLPDDVFETTAELQRLCDQAKPEEVMALPLIWPSDAKQGIVQKYWDDQKSADQSGFSFARVLERFLEWRNSEDNEPESAPCLKRINLLAHSMGNRVLRQTLMEWDRYDLASGVPLLFRNTFMVAADVVNETVHEHEPGVLVSHASRNVVVYFASDDLALRASKAANLRNKVASRRLGHTGQRISIERRITYFRSTVTISIRPMTPPPATSILARFRRVVRLVWCSGIYFNASNLGAFSRMIRISARSFCAESRVRDMSVFQI
ncbi:alpha/beta hydrolase [Ruegeria sp. A3M17]|uniref:alpha/beta hydrolase n=1 Tax=Ruegeria sp. A3M17 TaxID=2267229 RepID=UPI001F1CA680|nr:alpha/beta hydrolase [Ruegeria sp. A3M17]